MPHAFDETKRHHVGGASYVIARRFWAGAPEGHPLSPTEARSVLHAIFGVGRDAEIASTYRDLVRGLLRPVDSHYVERMRDAIFDAATSGDLVVFERKLVGSSVRRDAQEAPPPSRPPPPPVKQPWWLVHLEYAKVIAPGAEDPKPKVEWRIHDPTGRVIEARLELYRTADPEHTLPIWTRLLTPSEYAHGVHDDMEWDGLIGGSNDFPDGYVSVEFSQYTFKLVASDGGGAVQSRACAFAVQVVDLTLELGSKDLVALDDDKAVVEALKALPEAGDTQGKPVELVSNLFVVERDERTFKHCASFSEYRTRWGEGPRIPIVARVRFKRSDGEPVLAPLAWGRRRVVWDWECVEPKAPGLDGEAQKFVKQAQDFHKSATKPTGENCHRERGGKRSLDGKPAVFSASSGGRFPYPVTAAENRKQAAMSAPAKGGAEDGVSGVIFQPARMAGDGYKVTAWFDSKEELDKEGTLSAELKQETGTFRIWRTIHLATLIKKKAGIKSFAPDKVAAYFKRAFMKVEDRMGDAQTMGEGQYNKAFEAALDKRRSDAPIVESDKDRDTLKKTLMRFAIPAPGKKNQYDGDWAVTFNSYWEFTDDVLAAIKKKYPDIAEAKAKRKRERLLEQVGLDTHTRYCESCDGWADEIVGDACDDFLGYTKEGVTILQFADAHNQVELGRSLGRGGREGWAPVFASSDRTRVAIVQYFAANAAYYYPNNSETIDQTIAHEMGHQLFLSHAPSPAKNKPDGEEPAAHDPKDPSCMMSYNDSVEKGFCGLCVLRLRGWDHRALHNEGGKNQRG